MAIKPYLDLITSEHRTRPNYIALLQANLAPLEDSETCMNEMAAKFVLEEAQGAQLDIIGDIVGASRILNGTTLDDETFLLLIYAAILRNHWTGKPYDIYNLWETLFPDIRLRLKDQQNMHVQAVIIGNITETEKNMILAGLIIPRPSGVQMDYLFVDPSQPIFAWDIEGDYYAGWDTGYWQ